MRSNASQETSAPDVCALHPWNAKSNPFSVTLSAGEKDSGEFPRLFSSDDDQRGREWMEVELVRSVGGGGGGGAGRECAAAGRGTKRRVRAGEKEREEEGNERGERRESL